MPTVNAIPLCLLAFAYAYSIPISDTECLANLQALGVTDQFSSNVAHAVHSITIEVLQLFEATVSDINYVPTINANLSAPLDEAILPHAPHEVPSIYRTSGMRTLDQVLQHAGEPDYYLPKADPLNAVIHALHMQELWSMVKDIYYGVLLDDPPTEAQCQCATDIRRNGILDDLKHFARMLREPNAALHRHADIMKRSISHRNRRSPLFYYVWGGRNTQTYSSGDGLNDRLNVVHSERSENLDVTRHKRAPLFYYVWGGRDTRTYSSGGGLNDNLSVVRSERSKGLDAARHERSVGRHGSQEDTDDNKLNNVEIGKNGFVTVDSAAAWKFVQDHVTGTTIEKESAYDAAVFIYCTIHKAKL